MTENKDIIVTIQALIKNYDGLKEIIAKMIKTVKEKDIDTKEYKFSIDEEKNTLFVVERYSNISGFLAHTENMTPYAQEYFAKIELVNSFMHIPSDIEIPNEIKNTLKSYGTKFLTFVD